MLCLWLCSITAYDVERIDSIIILCYGVNLCYDVGWCTGHLCGSHSLSAEGPLDFLFILYDDGLCPSCENYIKIIISAEKNYNKDGERRWATILHKNMSRHLSTQLCLCKTRHFCVQLTLIRFGQQTMHWEDWEHREKNCHRKTMMYHMVILVITMMMIMNNQSVRCEINRSFPSPASRENLQVYNSSRQQWSLLRLSWN